MKINDQISEEIKKSTEYSANKTPYNWLDPKFAIFQNLPMRLKYQFLVTLYKELILDCPFFNSFDISFVVRLIPLVKPIKFDVGEFVWRDGDYSSNVYFLIEGKVKFVIEYESYDSHKHGGIVKKKTNRWEGTDDTKEKQTLKKMFDETTDKIIQFKTMTNGSYFGETDILLRRRRNYGLIATEESHMFYLPRVEFENIILNEFPHIYKEIKQLSLKREEKNLEMSKLAISKIQKQHKNAEEELFGDDSNGELSSDEEHHLIPELQTFFEEAKDKFPLEEMLKQTKFKKLLSKSSNSGSGSQSNGESSDTSSESSTDSYFEDDSEWEYDDIRSVGTEKIYNELEDVNNNLINRINYARNAAKMDFLEEQRALNSESLLNSPER